MHIQKADVLHIRYKGKKDSVLVTGKIYICQVIQYTKDHRSYLLIVFHDCNREKMLYDGFVFFATDWDIISEYTF